MLGNKSHSEKKNSHKGTFFEIEIYTSSESLIDKLINNPLMYGLLW